MPPGRVSSSPIGLLPGSTRPGVGRRGRPVPVRGQKRNQYLQYLPGSLLEAVVAWRRGNRTVSR